MSGDRAGGPTADRNAELGPFALFGVLTGLGVTSAMWVAAGVGGGWLLDEWLDLPHVFVFVGLVAGVALAVLSVRAIVRKYL